MSDSTAKERTPMEGDRARSLINNAPYGIFRSTVDRRFALVNPALVRMLGYDSEAELLAIRSIADLYEDPTQARALSIITGAVNRFHNTEVRWLRKDGTPVTLEMAGRRVLDGDGELVGMEVFVQDLSKERRLEAQLRQAQKMEAVGRLAADVAHDFNNILTVIRGECQLLLRDLDEDDPLREGIVEIEKAGVRGVNLTKQLLAFSRTRVAEDVLVDVDEVVAESSTMLDRLLSEGIELEVRTETGDSRVMANRGELEQMLANLVANARDAMPEGGKVTIATGDVTLTPKFVSSHPGSRAGDYVLLSVSDTGTGMDEATVARVFEPFFTTKDRDKGTGLGLAMVYGVAKRLGGYVDVKSRVEEGTEIGMYLPRSADRPSMAATAGVNARETRATPSTSAATATPTTSSTAF